jgi:hypothetical protein
MTCAYACAHTYACFESRPEKRSMCWRIGTDRQERAKAKREASERECVREERERVREKERE